MIDMSLLVPTSNPVSINRERLRNCRFHLHLRRSISSINSFLRDEVRSNSSPLRRETQQPIYAQAVMPLRDNLLGTRSFAYETVYRELPNAR